KPWENAEAHKDCREQWERYNKRSREVLKTVEDFNEFYRYLRRDRTRPELNRRGGTLGYAIRMFLNAYKGSHCGLQAVLMLAPELVKALKGDRWPVTIDRVKRADAAKFEQHLVPRTSE